MAYTAVLHVCRLYCTRWRIVVSDLGTRYVQLLFDVLIVLPLMFLSCQSIGVHVCMWVTPSVVGVFAVSACLVATWRVQVALVI